MNNVLKNSLFIILLTIFIGSCSLVNEPDVKSILLMENVSAVGLSHEPYGWDNLYGDKEIPTIWWERSPRDPRETDEVEIIVAAGTAVDGMDIWLEWTKNGIRMNSIDFQHKANLKAEGVAKRKLIAPIGKLKAGDKIEYTICAGDKDNTIVKRWLGVFGFSVTKWETIRMYGFEQQENGSIILLGQTDELGLEITAGFDANDICKVKIDSVLSNNEFKKKYPKEIKFDKELIVFSQNKNKILKIPSDSFDFKLISEGHEVMSLSTNGLSILTDGVRVDAVKMVLNAQLDESYYGFGMRYDSLNQRGKTVDVYTVNWYTNQISESYTPVPYYFVPNKYGVFVDSTYYSRFAMNSDIEGACVIEVNTSESDSGIPFYFFTGTNADIANQYAITSGRAVLPPVWSFGPWISANEWNKQSEIMEQMNKTIEHRIPTSVIVLEAWSDEDTFYIFNDAKYDVTDGKDYLGLKDFKFKGKWPNPKAMVDTLHENGIKVLLWQIPVLKHSSENSDMSVRDQQYAVESGFTLLNENKTAYRLPHDTWFGGSLLIDFTNKDATKWFLEKRKYLLDGIGIDGFKTDGGEFIWGRNVIASDGRRGDELRNAYPDLYSQAYFDYSREIIENAVTFSRAGGSKMQLHPFAWVGDQKSNLKAYENAIRATLSASMSGIPFVAWDIAGFSGDVPTALLYQRSTAQAAFSPVMQLHSEASGDPSPSQARTPWNMAERKENKDCLNTYKYFSNVRMNLIPYIYSEARNSALTGEPLMRSMAYAFPEDEFASEYEFQYMFGENLLVAPVVKITSDIEDVKVYLPKGNWYGLFNGLLYEGGTHIISCGNDEIPVFVKEGSIIPLNTDLTGELGSFIGNSSDKYNSLKFWIYPGTSEQKWYDYVNENEIILSNENGRFRLSDNNLSYDVIYKGLNND